MNALRRLLPSGREVLGVPLLIDISDRAVFATVIHEFCGENVSCAQKGAVLEDFFIDHGEPVFRLDIEHEVDVVLKDVREFNRDAIVDFGVRGRLEQRAVDCRAGSASADLERILKHVAVETVRVARDLQGLAVGKLALEADEFSATMHESQ